MAFTTSTASRVHQQERLPGGELGVGRRLYPEPETYLAWLAAGGQLVGENRPGKPGLTGVARVDVDALAVPARISSRHGLGPEREAWLVDLVRGGKLAEQLELDIRPPYGNGGPSAPFIGLVEDLEAYTQKFNLVIVVGRPGSGAPVE